MGEIKHGGRLDEAVSRYGGPRSKWIDLSTGINPKPYPVPKLEPSVWQKLPDALAQSAAIEAVRQTYDVDDGAGISLASGTQMHIQILPFLFRPQDVAIVGYTYQEHGICWQRAGHSVFVTDGLQSAEATARIVIVVNPNNPDGACFDPDELFELSQRLGAKGGLLVVDESFVDVTPEISTSIQAGRDGLLVMRSFGKFFGLAGLRFGSAIGPVGLTRRLDDRLGPWAVSGPALEIATTALNDKKWQTKSRKSLVLMRKQLEELLLDNEFEVVGGTDLFVLTRHPRAGVVFEHLANAKILTRIFEERVDWLRFGLPPRKTELNRLGRALASFNAEN